MFILLLENRYMKVDDSFVYSLYKRLQLKLKAIPNYTIAAQIGSKNDNLHIFGHLQAFFLTSRSWKWTNSINAQSTNCENHMADQDHVTHTMGV